MPEDIMTYDESKEILADYDQNQEAYSLYAKSLESLLNTLIRNAGYSIHSISSRVKTRDSLSEKILRKDKYNCINDITDIVGVRIITHYSDDVDLLAKLIEKEFIIDKKNSIDKRATMEPDRFGYLSLHYVINLNNKRSVLGEHALYKNIKAEVQIRSILQHAWAEIEHDIGYKSVNGLPNEIKRYFSRLAGLLEIADDEFIKIKDSINTRQQEVATVLEGGEGKDNLDLVSLVEYLNKSRTVSEIAMEFSKTYKIPIKSAGKDIDSTLDELIFIGVKNIKQLDNLFNQNRKSIINRIKAFSSNYVPTFQQQGIPRETLAAFLSQIIVAMKNSPEFERDFADTANLSFHKDGVHVFFEKIRKTIQ